MDARDRSKDDAPDVDLPSPPAAGETPAGRAPSGTAGLWVLFLGAHAFVVWVTAAFQNTPANDVIVLYGPWARSVLADGPIPGITEPWIYPPGALLPMLAVQLVAQPLAPLLGFGAATLICWSVFIVVIDVIAFDVLLGNGRSRSRRAAAAFWCAVLAAAGPAGMYRIEGVTVPLGVVALCLIVRRPAVAGALLALGAWIKVWPAALLLAGFALLRGRIRLVVGAVVPTVPVVAAVLLLGGAVNLFGFAGGQLGRGLQLEAVGATPLLWLAVAGSARIAYDPVLLTYEVVGPGAEVVAGLLTPLMGVAAAAIALLGALRRQDGIRVLPPCALALVTVLIVCNKVGSAQFVVWLIPPVVLWLVMRRFDARTPVVLVLCAAALTQAVYPVFFGAVIAAEPLGIGLLTARNLLLVVLLAVCIRRMLDGPRQGVRTRRQDLSTQH